MGAKNTKETTKNEPKTIEKMIGQSNEQKIQNNTPIFQSPDQTNRQPQLVKNKDVDKFICENSPKQQVTFYHKKQDQEINIDQSTVMNQNLVIKECCTSLDINLQIIDEQTMDVNGCRNKLRTNQLELSQEHEPIVIAILDDLDNKPSLHHPSEEQAKPFKQSHIIINNRKIAGVWMKLGPYRVVNLNYKPYQINEDEIYMGEWYIQKKSGYGTLITNNYIYEGFWLNDQYQGDGRIIYNDGTVYIGEFKNGKYDGNGVYIGIDQILYEGEWQNDQKNGIGKEQLPDGSVFIGSFQQNQRNGYGKLFNNKEQFVFEGEWQNGKAKEKGILVWQDGRRFEGEWINGMMHGLGKFTWPGNKQYIGNYVNNVRDGYGEYYYPDGKIYKGMWKSGLMNGQGIIIYPNNTHEKGFWKKGKRIIQEESKKQQQLIDNKNKKFQINKPILPL